MKKHNSQKLALRTETLATLTADDLRRTGGGSNATVGFTSQLSNAAFTFQIRGAFTSQL